MMKSEILPLKFPEIIKPAIIEPTREDLLTLQVLSLRDPWAHAIFHLGKDVENRSWYSHVRGDILIHVSKTFDNDGDNFLCRNFTGVPRKQDLPLGHIIGKVRMTDCRSYRPGQEIENAWISSDNYYFKLANKRLFSKPIPMKGKLKFFRLSESDLNNRGVDIVLKMCRAGTWI